MSLQTISNMFTANGSGSVGIFAMSGDFPFKNWCDNCGNDPCSCFSATSVYDPNNPLNANDLTYTVTMWVCQKCGASMPMGTYHVCQWSQPGTGTAPVMIPSIFSSPPLQECALCDKVLESDDKKVCKDCRGVFEAWKFLTKKPDPEPEEE